jgi:hypothetical protein
VKRAQSLRTSCGRLSCVGRPARLVRTGSTWKPLVLRWGRRSRVVAGAARGVRAVVTTYLASLHLHFKVGGFALPLGASAALRPCCATSADHLNRPVAYTPPALAALLARTRIVEWRDRYASGMQASRAAASPRALVSPSLVPQRMQGRRGALGGAQDVRHPWRMSSPAAPRSTGAWLPLRTGSVLVHRATRSPAAPARRKELGSSLAGPAALDLRREPRSITTHASSRHPAPGSGALNRVLRESRAAEMVWRTRADGETASCPQGAGAWRDAARAAAAAPAPETPPAAAVRAPDGPALTPDPSFIDRLADDVIRRIDRRERIARERRGL